MIHKHAVDLRLASPRSASFTGFVGILCFTLGLLFVRSLAPAWVVFASDGPLGAMMAERGRPFCNVALKSEHRVIPQVKFGRSLEDMDPAFDRREFFQNMIVKPDPASLQ